MAVFSTAMSPVTASQFTIAGTCSTLPAKGPVVMGNGATTATLSLSGGVCANGQTLAVSVDPTAVTDVVGVAGTGPVVKNTFEVVTSGPSAALGTFSATVLGATGTSMIALTFAPSAAGGNELTGALTEAGGGVTVTTLSGTPACTIGVRSLTSSGGTITVSGCQGNGALSLHINAGAVRDRLGNLSTVSSESALLTIDNLAPTLTLLSPGSGSVNPTPASIVAVFSTPVKALTGDAFTLAGNCTALPTKGSVAMSAGNTTATLGLSGGTCTSGQALTVSVAPTWVASLQGTAGVGPVVTNTYLVQTGGPAASLSAPSATTINASGTSTIALTFTPSAAGGTALTGTLTTTGSGVTVTSLTGNPSCTVGVGSLSTLGAVITLSACQGSGTLSLHVDAGAATDVLGNPSTASDESRVVTIDNTSPTLTLFSPGSSSVNSPPASVVAVFSEPVEALSSSAFTLGGTCGTLPIRGAVGMGSTAVTATLALSGGTCTADQTLTVSIDPTVTVDRAGNPGMGSVVTNTYTVRTSGPLTSLGTPSSSLVNSSRTSTLTVTFTPSQSGNTTLTGSLTAAGGGVTVTSLTGAPSCSVGVSSMTTSAALITLSACQGTGTLTVHVNDGVVQDGVGNKSTVTPESAVITVDNTGPTLTLLGPAGGLVNPMPTVILAVFSKPVNPLSAGQFTLGGTCTTLPSKGSVLMGAGNTTATLTLSGGACADGQTLTVEVDPSAVSDGLGNAGTGSIVTNTFTLDTVGPSASLGAPSVTLMGSSGTSTLALTFTPSPSGGTALTGTLTASGGGVTVTGTPSCTVSVTALSASGALITLSACQGSGTLTVHVNAGTAVDALGNASTVSPESATLTIDNTGPTLTSLSPLDAVMLTPPNSIVADFSEAVNALSTSQFTLGGTCTTPPTKGSVQMSAGNTTATLELLGGACAHAQALTVSLNPVGVTDSLGNAGTGAVVTRTYTVNTVGPIVSVGMPTPATVSSGQTSTIAVTFTPSLAGGNTLTGSLTAGGGGVTLEVVRGDPSCTLAVNSITASGATLSLSACTGNGRVRVQVQAGALTDALGNPSSASAWETLEVANVCPVEVGGYDYGDTVAKTITSADVNVDGPLDLVVGTPTSVGVLLGCASHTYKAVVSYPVPAGSGQVAIGDFNGDTLPDLVAGGADGGVTSVSVLWNTGASGFGSPTVYPLLDESVLATQVGDFNGDGQLDIAAITASPTSTTVSVLLNNGSGLFTVVHNTGQRATSNTLTPDLYNCRSLAVLPGADQGSTFDHLAIACSAYSTADIAGVPIAGRLIVAGVNANGTLFQNAVRTTSMSHSGESSVAYARGGASTIVMGNSSVLGVTNHPLDSSWQLGTQATLSVAPVGEYVIAKPTMVLWYGNSAAPPFKQFRAVKRTALGALDNGFFSLISNLPVFQALTIEENVQAMFYVTGTKLHGTPITFNVATGRPIMTSAVMF